MEWQSTKLGWQGRRARCDTLLGLGATDPFVLRSKLMTGHSYILRILFICIQFMYNTVMMFRANSFKPRVKVQSCKSGYSRQQS